jgi:hypothetical protein
LKRINLLDTLEPKTEDEIKNQLETIEIKEKSFKDKSAVK